jgi:hypothetical protein
LAPGRPLNADPLSRPKAMLKEPVHPAETYVNLFLLEMLQAEKGSQVVRASVALPVLRDNVPPDFARFRNRLKIMAGLDPVTYPTPKNATLEIAIDRKDNGQWHDCRYTVSLLFTDARSDPSVELRAELKSQEPGVDPELCLY